jgi:hypothetical protein
MRPLATFVLRDFREFSFSVTAGSAVLQEVELGSLLPPSCRKVFCASDKDRQLCLRFMPLS